MESQYFRVGTDRGASVEVTLNPNKVIIRTVQGAPAIYDHQKDVSEFLNLTLAEVIKILDNLSDAAQSKARDTTKKAIASGERKRRYLEIV